MFQTASQGQPDQPDLNAVDALIQGALTAEERASSVAYLDTQLRPAGRDTLGGHDVDSAAPFLVAFIDQKPGANWMHPCRYLLIVPATGKITSNQSDRPPAFGPLPPTWKVAWRSRGIEDWRLLPISGPTSQQPK